MRRIPTLIGACLAAAATASAIAVSGGTAQAPGDRTLTFVERWIPAGDVFADVPPLSKTTTGKGDGPAGAALNPKPRDFSVGDFKYDTDKDGKPGTDADLANIIKNGAGAYGGSPLMAPWGHLSDADIQNVIAYVHSLMP